MRVILRSRLCSRSARFAVSLVVMAAAFAVTAALNEAEPGAPSAVIFAAALVIAWIAGLAPAVVASLLAGAALVCLRQPVGAWHFDGSDALWMAQFLGSVSAMAWLTTWVRYLQEDRALLLSREREARAQAEAANAAKDGFLAVVSHEMKTPLTAIVTWTELVRRNDGSSADRARAADTIARNAQLQSKLIDDLLDVSLASAGKFAISLSDIDASELVRQVIQSHEPRTLEAKIKLISTIEPDVRILGDLARLEQVLGNLLSNALKFTPAGGRISVSVDRHANAARITVADSGRGIEPAHLECIFDRFWQDTRLGRPAGLGLGLAIVRHIVDAHGGHVWAESLGAGHGATFVVQLPLRPNGPTACRS